MKDCLRKKMKSINDQQLTLLSPKFKPTGVYESVEKTLKTQLDLYLIFMTFQFE